MADLNTCTKELSTSDSESLMRLVTTYFQPKGVSFSGTFGRIVEYGSFINLLEDDELEVHLIDPEMVARFTKGLAKQKMDATLEEVRPIGGFLDDGRTAYILFPEVSLEVYFVTNHLEGKKAKVDH
ncbi:Hypothetical protein FKW44_025124 [Caligus rogercresseyi]|uniref:Uncharacterized protein n=2 Tax=Caligus rogercresseyi TaxID=217165 RepID=A0A7T8GK80_CALRO|nr:Hypothetical protein FKW44_025118 [Caligus rogercresseyi]QQP31505.1 Hypothetical protein FKW44_025122 [Caligus rogercresseyi]QQP31506.1 Hypothetical protein FKW44_025124 [Caligus rogercresseyi]